MTVSNPANEQEANITGMTLAVTQMERMISFYSNVFQLNFEEVKMYGSSLYKTELGGVEILFCPADIAQNTAKQNRHQLNVVVNNLKDALSMVEQHEGSILGEPNKKDGIIEVGIKDPDNNSIVLIQKVKN